MSDSPKTNVERLREAGVLKDHHVLTDEHVRNIEALSEDEMTKIINSPAHERRDESNGLPFQHGGEE